MTLNRRRVRAIVRKELRAYQRNRAMVVTMAVIPLVFLIQPLVAILTISAAAGEVVSRQHELLYLLGVPALAPAMMAAYAVVAERQQGTLEPILSTPISRNELLLGKALAVLLPAVAISYAVFAVYVALVAVFAHPSIANALIRTPDVVAQVVFTPLVAAWSIWIAIAISTRSSDIRVAQQLSSLASLPTVAVTTLLAVGVIHPTLPLAVLLGVALLIATWVGWRVVARLLDRERLITSAPSG